jgi:C-terminal processing protease CtpA/Prc
VTTTNDDLMLVIPRMIFFCLFRLPGYAYDAGMRVGDKLLAIDDFVITPTTPVDEVRNHLRGEPGTPVSITFLREGVGGGGTKANEPQTITLNRSVVRIPDVKYFGEIM